MNESELRARVDALEKLVARLLRETGHDRRALSDLRSLAHDPQKTWMAEYWWHSTSNMNEDNVQALAELAKTRQATFPD